MMTFVCVSQVTPFTSLRVCYGELKVMGCCLDCLSPQPEVENPDPVSKSSHKLRVPHENFAL